MFEDIKKCKESLVTEIKALQDLLELTQTYDLLRKEADLLSEFDVILEQEEVLWFQKSRERWIALGDRNIKYYHTTTMVRRRKNKIEALKDDDGSWIMQSLELEKLATEYYRKLYSMDDVEPVVERLNPKDFRS